MIGKLRMRDAGLMKSIMNDFGEPELLDDLLDHWSSTRHVEEKGLLVNDLRNLAAERRLRITILSGDVHLAAYAFCASSDKYTDLAADPGFIPQVISSAIAYDPVGGVAVGALDKASGFDTSVVYPHEPKVSPYSVFAGAQVLALLETPWICCVMLC